jgi:acetyl-CoA C-acetyltransferase
MARISAKDHDNALNNPYAHIRIKVTPEDVLNSRVICWPIKLLDVCPRSDGACAVVFASEEKARKITATPAWVLGAGAVTASSTPGEEVEEAGFGTIAVKKAYKMAGIDNPRKQIDVVEAYDPFSTMELMYYPSFGFCDDPKEAVKMVEEGFGEMTGEVPFSPSGGVLCSNPIGATALVRVAEAALQVMGKAGDRQVPDVKVALATGAGGSPGPGSATFITATILGKEPR